MPSDAAGRSVRTAPIAVRIWICLGIFIVLMAWRYFFPFSGDGDSILHYLNARETAKDWSNALYAWTRPGYKIPLSFFATHGVLAAHFFNALITVAVAWNTMRLAEELRIPRAPMAGLLLILQPFVFVLGADTMTEMPMALGLVLAIRWWRNGRHALACLLVGYLPSVRPEGFFFGLIFGVLVLMLFARRRQVPGRSLPGDLARALGLLGCLSVGLALWVLLCWRLTYNHDPLSALHNWSWPADSSAIYPPGSILHYVIYWPYYCGLPLLVLFVAGIGPSWRRSMWLPWVVWLTVIGVHSILYWRAWFASGGLIRIMACSSPVTALICLYGWNAIARRLPVNRLRPAAIVFMVLASASVVGNYCLDPNRLHFLPIRKCADYVRQTNLLDTSPKPWFFCSDKIAIAMLQGQGFPDEQVMKTPPDQNQVLTNLRALPIGSIGIWDDTHDEQTARWHRYTIDELSHRGFTILYETHLRIYSFLSLIQCQGPLDLHYAVLRKTAPGPV